MARSTTDMFAVALSLRHCQALFQSKTQKDAWPFVQVCPVVELGEGQARVEAAEGHSTRYAPLPGIGDAHFADLTVCITIEKALLLGLGGPRSGCRDDLERERFAAAVARSRVRFPFPDGFNTVMNPLRSRWRKKRSSGDEGELISDVKEVRARPQTLWSDIPVRLELIFIVISTSLPPASEATFGVTVTDELQRWAEVETETSNRSETQVSQ